MATINLLGEVTATAGGRPAELGGARQRCVLAALAVDAGRVVPVDRLVERVWAPDVPRRARETLHSYVSRLRQALSGDSIVRRAGGYVLTIEETDLRQFRDLCARARSGAHAAQLLTEALGLWHGEALTGLDSEWALAERDRLHQERLAAEHELVDVRLRMGQGEELLIELSTRAAAHPLDERVAGQYLLALSRAGRAADALAHYRRFRERLVTELGIDPGAALRELHQQILRGAGPAADAADPAAVPVETGPVVVPRQLPAAPAPFVGRRAELDRLDAVQQDLSATVVISAIAGAGGIGKTWLALHWAHQYVDKFADGQLFVDLRGFSPEGPPMAPEMALRGFLDALGVEPQRVPVDAHAQSALFRSLVAGKRMLLVLDNAVDTSQVTPLLPGSDTCTVVVTSRNRLPGLITGHGARHMLLDVLSDAEARALLTNRLGARADDPATADLITLCGGFPLALSIVAAHAHLHPDLPLADLAAELRDLGLDALDGDDPTASLPAVLSWSLHTLTAEQVRMFALLGSAPGPDIGLAAAASLAGRSSRETGAMLRALAQASLVTETNRRYRMHELVRDHAAHLDSADRATASRRVVDHYLRTAHAADRVLSPERQPIELTATAAPGDPLAWLAGEHQCLLAAQQMAVALGWHREVWQLAWSLNTYHYRRGLFHDEQAVWQAALAAADHLGVPTTRILARRQLGRVLARVSNYAESLTYLQQALTLAEAEGDRGSEAEVIGTLSLFWVNRGDQRKALGYCVRALELFRQLGDLVREAQSLNNIGWLSAQLGDYEQGRRHCLDALALHRRHHFRDGEAATLDSLGYVEHHDGDHTRAVDYYQQALALKRELGDAYESANTLDGLGHPYVALGQIAEARAAWQEARDLYESQDRPQDAARVAAHLAKLP